MMKHKPCFWRRMLQSGPRTRLSYTQPRLSACSLRATEKPSVDSASSVTQPPPEGAREGTFLIASQQYRYFSRDNIKHDVPEGKLDPSERKHAVKTAESSKRN